MKFAVALIAITFLSQALPVDAQESAELAFGVNLDGNASVNVVGGGSLRSKELALTDDQKEKLYELKNQLLNDIGPKKAELGAQKRQLKNLLTSETLDRKAIQATQDKINSLTTELSNRRIAFRMDVQENLTADQKKAVRYKSMKGGKRHHKMKMRRHRADQGGGSPIVERSVAEPIVSQLDVVEDDAIVEEGNI